VTALDPIHQRGYYPNYSHYHPLHFTSRHYEAAVLHIEFSDDLEIDHKSMFIREN
jgi:hypothetical protein